jgi:hypothetical protein
MPPRFVRSADVRLYTATTPDNLPVLTINAGSVAEACHVLRTILGADDGLLVRIASASEADAWRATASSVERSKMRRRSRKKNPGTTDVPGRVVQTEESLSV